MKNTEHTVTGYMALETGRVEDVERFVRDHADLPSNAQLSIRRRGGALFVELFDANEPAI